MLSPRHRADGSAPRPGGRVRLLRQGLGFSAVGGLQLLLDWGVMMGLSASGIPLPAANVAGRVAGASLGFWANRQLTFTDHDGPASRHLLRFLLLWSVLTVLSTLQVEYIALHGGLSRAWLLKPLIEALLAVVSFLASRYWVYR